MAYSSYTNKRPSQESCDESLMVHIVPKIPLGFRIKEGIDLRKPDEFLYENIYLAVCTD